MKAIIMNAVYRIAMSTIRSLNDLTRINLTIAAIFFLVGALFTLASPIWPGVGDRGTVMFFVGCFYLTLGVIELLKQISCFVGYIIARRQHHSTLHRFEQTAASEERAVG